MHLLTQQKKNQYVLELKLTTDNYTNQKIKL